MTRTPFDLLPLVLLTGGAVAIFCLGAFRRSLSTRVLAFIAFFVSLATGVSLFLPAVLPADVAGLSIHEVPTRLYMALLCGLTGAAILFTSPYARARGFERDELYALMLLATMGMLVLVAARDWLYFFLGLELLSLCLYVLIGSRKDASSVEGAVKYLLMGAVASSFLVFGIAMIYGAVGTTDMAAGLGVSSPGPLVLFGFGLILAGVGFKLSWAPFHLWTPDVYEGAPAPVAAFLSTGSKLAVFAAFLKLYLMASDDLLALLDPLICGLAALTMTAGTLGALTQDKLKRVLAFSSVSHMGYLLMALAVTPVAGVGPVLFYSVAYGIMDLGAFGGLALLSHDDNDLNELDRADGLGFVRPWPAALLALSLLALAGMPPTVGFMGKFVIFQSVLEAGYTWLAVLGILMAVLSIYYYLRPLTHLYMRPPGAGIEYRALTVVGAVAVAIVLAGLFLPGIVPQPLLDVANAMGRP